MASPDVALRNVSIVVRGLFNPAIISPLWLRDQDLIGAEEYEKAEIGLISPDLTSFQAGWLRCHVTPESFSVSTLDADETERMRDVAAGVLRTLRHTPIGALGINVDMHFVPVSVAARHRIGHELAPKSHWKAFLRDPLTMNVSIRGLRPDFYVGHVQVTVQPSTRVAEGVTVSQNDHFDLELLPEVSDTYNTKSEQPPQPSPEKLPIAVTVLDNEWRASMERADAAFRAISSLGLDD